MPNSEFMIHYGSVSFDSNSISAKSAVDQNEKLNKRMLEIYSDKCEGSERFSGWTLEKIKKYLDTKMRQKQEWYMTACEAVEYGFADSVLGDEKSPSIEEIL